MDTFNRIPTLKSLLEDIYAKRSDAMAEAAEKLAPRFLRRLIIATPESQVEPTYNTSRGTVSHGRPGIRLHGISARQGWDTPSVRKSSDGASVVFTNKAPQLEFLLQGTRPHQEEFVSFWWGAPLRWNPVPSPGPGSRYYAHIAHPGAIATNIPDIALKAGGLQDIIRARRESIQNLVKPFREFFGA